MTRYVNRTELYVELAGTVTAPTPCRPATNLTKVTGTLGCAQNVERPLPKRLRKPHHGKL